MQIRRFLPSDEEEVVSLWTSVFGYSAPHNEPALVIHCKLAEQPELFFVAIEGERLVGTVMGGYDGHRGWIYSLAVQPGARRRGIGTALVQHVEQALTEKSCVKVNLQIFASNAAVVEFYLRLGYSVEERVSMGRLLDPSSAD